MERIKGLEVGLKPAQNINLVTDPHGQRPQWLPFVSGVMTGLVHSPPAQTPAYLPHAYT